MASCDPPRGEVRTWQAADHGRGADAKAAGQTPQDIANKDASQGLAQTVWTKSCQSCHGPFGRGDGPLGPSLQVADLTREDWLGGVSDAEIAKVIREGRGKMPAHPDLPEATLNALVKRIRNKGR